MRVDDFIRKAMRVVIIACNLPPGHDKHTKYYPNNSMYMSYTGISSTCRIWLRGNNSKISIVIIVFLVCNIPTQTWLTSLPCLTKISQRELKLWSTKECLYIWMDAVIKPLRKHAYSNILKILPPKHENFQIKNFDIFHISAQNIDCGYSLEPPRWGGSNEYPQSMFWAQIRKIIYTPVNPSFTSVKEGFKGGKII